MPLKAKGKCPNEAVSLVPQQMIVDIVSATWKQIKEQVTQKSAYYSMYLFPCKLMDCCFPYSEREDSKALINNNVMDVITLDISSGQLRKKC